MFEHTRRVRQTYCEHLYDAIGYSMASLKASFVFLVHGIYPDIWEYDGSMIIQSIHEKIQNKKRNLMNFNFH